MSPTISVIIPVYNAEATISHTVDSILRQTFCDYELLLIDDGSTDSSLEKCRSLEEADSRIHVYSQKNGGVSAARNSGINHARGEYLAFIDADDLVASNYLERLLRGFSNQGVILSMCGHERIRTCSEIPRAIQGKNNLLPASLCIERLLEGRFPIGVWGIILQRERLGDLRFPTSIRNNEDKFFLFSYLILNEKGKVAFTNDKLYGYLVRDGSASRSGWNGSTDMIWVADQIAEMAVKTHPEWTELANNTRLAARFNTLKAIIRSGTRFDHGNVEYREIKNETIRFDFPRHGGRRLKVEWLALQLGDYWYWLLVKGYYFLTNDRMRFHTNDSLVSQRECR